MDGGGNGVGLIDCSLVKTGKWSDGQQWVEESDGAREESEEVKNVVIVVGQEIHVLTAVERGEKR